MEILKLSFKYLKKNTLLVILLLLTNITSAFINIYITYVTGKYIDSLVYIKSKNDIFQYTILFLITTLIVILSNYLSNMIRVKLQNKTVFYFQDDIFEHVKKLPIDYFDDKDTVYLTDRISKDCNEIIEFTISSFLNVLINIFSLFIYSYFLILLDFKVLLFLILFIPVYCIIYHSFKKPLYNANYIYKENQNNLYVKSYNQIKNIKFIKSHSLFNIVRGDFEKSFYKTFLSGVKNMKIYSLFLSFGSITKGTLTVILFFYSGIQIISQNMTIGNFIILNKYLSKILSSIEYLLNFTTIHQSAKVSMFRIKDILNMTTESNGDKLLEKIEKVELKNVSFNYNSKTIIQNFSYEFKKGKIYGLLGPNGIGKSTLVYLILGILKKYDGDILYNSTKIEDLNLYHLRFKNIGFADQSPVLIKDSIDENIAYDVECDIDFNLVKNFFYDYNINYFIDSKGRLVNKNSNLLSGGEMQKISLIRSLLKNPDILILDEPTTYLDKDGISTLKKQLNEIKENSIIIVVSHDSDFLDIMDFKIDLSHPELISDNKMVTV